MMAHVLDSLFSFGFYNPYWTGPGVKERPPPDDFLDIKGFDPSRWSARDRNTAFKFMTRRDAYWAVRIISRFSDEWRGLSVPCAGLFGKGLSDGLDRF